MMQKNMLLKCYKVTIFVKELFRNYNYKSPKKEIYDFGINFKSINSTFEKKKDKIMKISFLGNNKNS